MTSPDPGSPESLPEEPTSVPTAEPLAPDLRSVPPLDPASMNAPPMGPAPIVASMAPAPPKPSRFARLRAAFRGDGLHDARLAQCRAAGLADPLRTLHAMDLRDLARAVYERREPAPASRAPQLAYRLSLDALDALDVGEGGARTVALRSLRSTGVSAWALSDHDADATTREILAELDRSLAPVEKPLARLARARNVARLRVPGAILAVAAVVGVIALGVFVLTRPRNLLADAHFRTSSASKDFDTVTRLWKNQRLALFFMTTEEQKPWIEFDLERPTTLRRVLVENRPDCCRDKASPLVVEVSDDQKAWKEVARIGREFFSWEAKFPAETTRYVRLRVDRASMLHLESVGAYAR